MQKLIILLACLFTHSVFAATINIVAAENFYGTLAKEIGGNKVKVTSIIENPDADPHLFATTAATSKTISNAQIILYNGANYDTWMEQILKTQSNKNITIVNIAYLMQLNKEGVNPHLWYKPETMPALAKYLTNLFIRLDSSNKAEYEHNLVKFLNENQIVQNKIIKLKTTYNATPVTATEPVFNYMTDAIGLSMQGLDFQWKIMNDTDPSPKMLSSYLSLFNTQKVHVLFYNNQVIDNTTKNILAIAKQNHIPVVGISETMPQNMSINHWLIDELTRTESALAMSKK